MDKTMVTVRGIAQELGVSRGTVYRWLREGRLRGEKGGGMWFVRLTDVEKLSRSRRG